MGVLHLRRALNEWTCRRCGRTIVAAFPLCESCARTVERINDARELLAEADADRERRWPPPRTRPLP
jgi:hypothetical protein